VNDATSEILGAKHPSNLRLEITDPRHENKGMSSINRYLTIDSSAQ
jgi:hypothetical protein